MSERHDPTLDRYLNGDYALQNPDWDSADAAWKAEKLHALLSDHQIKPSSFIEIGCGSGNVLVALQKRYPMASFSGYDISPDAQAFWKQHETSGIHFQVADYLSADAPAAELTMVFDVLEHLGNPWQFLTDLHARSRLLAIHFPLDLSAISVLRERPLLAVRNKVGHLHYFTRTLALALLAETGYEVIEARFTNAALQAPQRSLKTRLAGWLRWCVYFIDHDLGARLLGGETLMVLARPRKS